MRIVFENEYSLIWIYINILCVGCACNNIVYVCVSFFFFFYKRSQLVQYCTIHIAAARPAIRKKNYNMFRKKKKKFLFLYINTTHTCAEHLEWSARKWTLFFIFILLTANIDGCGLDRIIKSLKIILYGENLFIFNFILGPLQRHSIRSNFTREVRSGILWNNNN